MLQKVLVLCCLLSATSTLAQERKNTEKQTASETDYMQPGAPMPPLLLVSYYDTGNFQKKKPSRRRKADATDETPQMAVRYMTNKDLDNGANLFVMLFNPTCSHCEDATALMEKNIALFKKTKIVLMATNIMKPYLPDFIRSLHTADYPQIYVGTDSLNFISKVFLYSALPQINVYGKERKLLKIFTGEVELDSLKRYIE